MKYLAVVAAVVAVIGALRWWLLSTRMKRHRRQQAEAADPASGRPIEARLIALARWPVFIVLFAAAIALGLLAGMLVGRH